MERYNIKDVEKKWQVFWSENNSEMIPGWVRAQDVIYAGNYFMSPQDDLDLAINSARNAQLNLALLNNGVHSGTRFIMSAFHTEEDIAKTADAFANALNDIRADGLI